MKTKIFYLVILFSITYFSVNSQNLLDTSTWTVSSGSVSGFSQNGATSENSRELGRNHIGEEVVLWKATPDASSNADGGWDTSDYNVDHKKTYRLVVWLKKTNSNTGSSYFGFHSYSYNGSHHSLRLDGNSNNNPYFWSGDLPQLNKWYMLVGYVHGSNYSSTVNYGGIYDGVTGEKVRSITDFKFKSTATKLRHRTYLYYDTNTSDRQYFYAPRMELVDGNEPSVEELLKINDDSKLIISYDVAGNQTQNFYCNDLDFCSPPAARKTKKEEAIFSAELHEDPIYDEDTVENFAESVFVYPNPTDGLINIKLSSALIKNIHSIKLYNVNSSLVKEIKTEKEIICLDISEMADGVYFLHIHLKEGKSITKKIIKK